ncbi:NAD(P)-binding protein [Viridothelium virens]|uniref:NAD(P)-binding protein n=1 Tax=Viridothelium virens TaxID=1048519 RepID=A0A6A6HAF8_VIRVR|nr:NAD(P)-binding protein [Viridothelium virens]
MSTSNRPIAAEGSFKNRTVIVSGATGKLGRPICAALAAAGANVVINDVKADAVQELTDSLKSAGHTALLSITLSATSGPEIVAKALEQFGRVDAVINPTLGPIPWKPFEDLTDDDFRAAYENNVLGPISVTKAAWPHFKKQGYGRVVNFTSDSMLGFPTASAYTNTKGALFGMNKTLAMEGAAHGIKVNCVSPIAYHPNMERHILRFSDDVQHAFKTLYQPEANVPMILALVSEGCQASGEVFNTAGWAAGRNVWGNKKGVNGLETVDACLKALGQITEKGGDVFEPHTMVDFTEWQGKYVLNK